MVRTPSWCPFRATTTCAGPKAAKRVPTGVLAGEVVFFIGAGFSIDSECNTAARLIVRLLARFDAMTRFLWQEERLALLKKASSSLLVAQIRHNASRLRDVLKETFGLKGDTSPDCDLLSWDHVDILKKEYFHINDWMVSAFDDLLGDLENLRRPKWITRQVNVRENQLLHDWDDDWGDEVDLEPMDLATYLKLAPRARGKALFLDTMGFADPRIMCGTPQTHDARSLLESYDGRLLPRHHVLARLAREGLCSTLITTNYDLLIEGAYCASGFGSEGATRPPAGSFRPQPCPARATCWSRPIPEPSRTRRRAGAHSERELREWPWYCSTLDHPDWTAWGVVVELALRRMIAAWRGAPREWMSDCRWIAPQDHASPALVFSQGEARPAPALLAIRLVDFGRRSQPPVIPGAFKHRRLWELRPTSLPWVEASPSVGDIPSASLLWRWAAQPLEACPECDEDMGRYLGVDHVRG